MLNHIPTQAPNNNHVAHKTYLVARPQTVTTASEADSFVAGLLAGREDAELLSQPVLGRDRFGRKVVVVTVRPAGARLLASPVPIFTLVTAQA